MQAAQQQSALESETSILAAQLPQRQRRIHRAGTETLKVKGDKLEAERFEDAREFRRHLGSKGARQFIPGNLDAHDVAVVTNAELTKSQTAQRILALLDLAQRLTCDWAPVLDARGQTGRRRFVPHAQTGFARQVADLRFGQSGIEQGCGDVVLLGGKLAGTKIALIIQVYP